MTGRALRTPWVRAAVDGYLRHYHRHNVHIDETVPDTTVLFVANHGFGGLVDLNVAAAFSALDRAAVTRPVTALVHQLAWTMGLGTFVEAFGGVQASVAAVENAFAAERNVLVFPGGDIDAGKSWRDRNTVCFDGRTGYARMATECGVPIVPIVTSGAGESLFVLHDGRGLAAALRLPKLLRLNTLPVSISIPWGLSVGVAGMLPYVAFPTKLETAILPAMTAELDETTESFAARVEAAMQARLDRLVSENS
ncbi:1-acyl-sn-glycerol-3-phosphate acyltransferase [Antrihabitans sp. YC2-6]|uniref:1-acyl-sn-glycerol-3-phosphate acyltransferase n=1 Tax=Antrihabitans sp. YC2-6 TaxID=2799498 RepID=UPI0018F70BCD|nr:1-acyl-sn-glycerol-3-phosphate acyltransferase [Antrihabitans sp. YC2-6]MBJ8343824.1 1-acyl-sn-glycerol-3-phosphate acyltransferase [Antrihabitans sp. YC2-6]